MDSFKKLHLPRDSAVGNAANVELVKKYVSVIQ